MELLVGTKSLLMVAMVLLLLLTSHHKGDVSPIAMMPIAQSPFVPLTEVLCCVISEMNDSHITVTQEALMDYLVKCYPGIASPSQEILHNALSTLIRGRKVYHTEEGYFIVTSHTYFITGNAGKQGRSWVLGEERDASLPPVTYLVSVESGEDTPRDKGSPGMAHCKSCCCFDQQEPGLQGKGGSKEPRPSVQHRATSTATGQQDTEPGRAKEKENHVRKFRLGLFRRGAKKEGPKRQYGTFSAQFPPEEWPFLNESGPGDIPREVELQIIRRVNPGLTVDNLVRHTLLMKKLALENGGGAQELPIGKPRHRPRGSPQKGPPRARRQHRTRAAREKPRRGGSLQAHSLEAGARPEGGPREGKGRRGEGEQPEARMAQYLGNGTPPTQVHKRRIANPFSKLPAGELPSGRRRGSQTTRPEKARAERRGRAARCPESPVAAQGPHLAGEGVEETIIRLGGHHLPSAEDNQAPGRPESGAGGTGRGQAGLLTPGRPGDLRRHSAHHAGSAHPESEHKKEASGPQDDRLLRWRHGEQDPTVDLPPPGSLERLLTHPGRSSTPSVCRGQGGEGDEEEEEEGERSEGDETLYQRELEEDDACSSLYLDDADMALPSAPGLAAHTDWQRTGFEGGLETGSCSENWALGSVLIMEEQGADSESLAPSEAWSDNEPQRVAAAAAAAAASPRPGYPYPHPEGEERPAGCREATDKAFTCRHIAGAAAATDSEEQPKDDGYRGPAAGRKLRAVHRGTKAQLGTELPFGRHSHDGGLSQTSQEEHSQLENHSITGDSGIDSPRTRASLASNNSIVLGSLKRQSLMQSYGPLSSGGRSGVLSPHPLLQLTPVMNV
ncbi:storkhead-box protein 1 isoform X3 [Amblyraja radiata]|uniref:storkhead-box protein 1 isoform X3 n=1 Tax=Amblyraja radiata TaxID=386614 RepID=UPI001403E3E2|nr:storkhead-box protein 1 isoform X3 [Amblyraja radiata]